MPSMSFVIAAPEAVASAASSVANIGSAIGEANAAAVAPTTGVAAAAEDEVSAAIAALFSGHAQEFQALSTQAAAFHTEFVQLINGGAAQYAAAEAANASPLQPLLNAINAPTEALVGRPLIGNGVNGAPGTGANGGGGGVSYGNGGGGRGGCSVPAAPAAWAAGAARATAVTAGPAAPAGYCSAPLALAGSAGPAS